ncbi:glutathione peroxidase [Timonella sp. A28]|uniref:glutathione peroxidase n=1 Tax=Timonella sp. A28 TaxID=3442640 RepID=UPI003EB8855F
MFNDIDELAVAMIDGRETTLGEWSDSVKLVVNVASRCGLTPQYEGLENLQKTYGSRGFTVLGFPSQQFLQELNSEEKISEYCSLTWGVTFPMTQRVRVNGKKKHPLYAILHDVADTNGYSGRVRWNFEKFLITPTGDIQRFAPTTEPDSADIVSAIEAALAR